MRRRAVGQAERAAQPRHGELNDAGTERPAAGADENRPFRRQRMRAHRDIVLRSAPARFAAPAPCASCCPCRSRRCTSPSPGSGTSRRFSPSASEMRRPEPYSSAITAASRAQIQGSRSSPARSSASAKRLAAAIGNGFGRLLPILGARIADNAPTLPLPSRSRKRPNERKPASARISERLAISSARRIAMKALMSLASSAEKLAA